MRLDWLEDILAVAQTGSFTEAAERRHLTQSAFSRRIRQIEDHVGTELFDRAHKPVQLRPTLSAQRDQIETLAGQLRQLALDLRRGGQSGSARVTIISQHALTAARAPAIIREALAHNPDAFVRLRSANLDECVALLLARQADIALLYRLPGTDHPVRPDFVETVVIGADRLVPVIAADRAAWIAAQVARHELPCIRYPAEVFLGQVLQRAVLSQLPPDMRPVSRAETALTLAALEMALAGVAVAWIPLSLAQGRLRDGSLTDLSGPLPHCAMEVTAVRLARSAEDAVPQTVWSQIVRTWSPQPDGPQTPVSGP